MAISSIPTQLDDLKKLWDSYPDMQNQRLLDSYLFAVASVTSAAVTVMPENILLDVSLKTLFFSYLFNFFLQILQIICEILSRDLSASQKFSILQVLNNLSSVSVSSKNNHRLLEYAVAAFKSILRSESPIMRNIAYRRFTELSFSPTFMEHIGKTVSGDHKLKQNFSNFLMKILPSQEPKPPRGKIKFNHRCYEDFTIPNEGLLTKRIKLDDGSNLKTSLAQEALTRLEQDIYVVLENYSILSEEQKNCFQILHNNLAKFLNKI